MSVNLAIKYSEQIASSYNSSAMVSDKGDNSFEFTGVKGIRVFTPITVPLVDYVRNGSSRFGVAEEMGDNVQELLLSQDKAFTFIIDKGNNSEQMYAKQAGKMMALQIAERVVPTIEAYSLDRICKLAGKSSIVTASITPDNVMEEISKIGTAFDEEFVPLNDRYIVVTPAIYSAIRLSPDFLAVDVLAKEALTRGVVGSVLGFSIVKVPTSLMPEEFEMVAFQRNAVLFPNKLKDSRMHEDAPGVSGAIVEGRWIYDAFVLSARSAGVHSIIKSGNKPADVGFAFTASGLELEAGANTYAVYYTLDGSDPRYSLDAKVYTSPIDLEELGIELDKLLVKAVAVSSKGCYSDVSVKEGV